MNEKEARDIIGTNWVSKRWDGYTPDEVRDFQKQAEGYLEALEKARVLEEALDTIDLNTHDHQARVDAQRALFQWKKAK